MEAKINAVAEMFPNHRRDTIEAFLKMTKGNVDGTISILLDTPENTPPPQPEHRKHSENADKAHASSGAKPHAHDADPAHPAPVHPKRAKIPKFEHIFPEDFLRWPEDAEVIRVDRNGETPIVPTSPSFGVDVEFSESSEQTPSPDQKLSQSKPYDPNAAIRPEQHVLPNISVDAALLPGVDADKKTTAGWWKNFKSRFSKHKQADYQSLN